MEVVQASPELLFSLSSDKLDEWKKVLIQENIERIKNSSSLTIPKGHFDHGSFAETLFFICHEHDLSAEVRYVACEIFERFMHEHLTEMHKLVSEQKSDDQSKHKWDQVMQRIADQIALRIMSCCQIASKFISSDKHLTSKKVADQLKRLGHKYSEEAIIKSEVRVLKTINYQIDHSTPIVYIDLLLAIIADQQEEFKDFISENRKFSLDFLDILFLDKKNIYQSFAEIISDSQPTSQSERVALYAIERDFLFMAASVIAASTFITDRSKSDWVIECMSQITKIESSHIVDMCCLILKPFADSESIGSTGPTP